jgi:hypothetical protein
MGRERGARGAVVLQFYAGARRWEGQSMGWCHIAGEGRERGRGGVSHPDQRAAPCWQQPEADGRGWCGAAMPHGWSEQGRGREADRWGPGTVEGSGG